jgi:membrane-associated phospholipid phosphatase
MLRSPATALAALASLLVTAWPGPGRAAEPLAESAPPRAPDLRPRLTLDLQFHAVATGAMLLLSGVSQLEANRLAAPSCRWCQPNPLDRWARQELRWTHPKSAANLSDVLAYGLPAGAALTLALTARAEQAWPREAVEDLLVLTEVMAAGTLVTQVAKFATGRLRPDAWSTGGGGSTADSRMSFWGGHSMLAFSVAAGATQVGRLRGRPGWGWLAAFTFAGAAATGWMRMAADRHWLTDVVVGAGVGTAVGLGVPLLVLHPAGERSAVTLVPAPGGLALLF